MRALKQRYRHKPDEGVWGDCHRAAIASVLHLELDDVPHFGDGGPDGPEFTRRVDAFLASRGIVQLHCLYLPVPDSDHKPILQSIGSMNPGVYFLFGGRSRTGVDHTVVCCDGEIVHDPSLNEAGIIDPCDDGFYWATFFGVALATKRAMVPT